MSNVVPPVGPEFPQGFFESPEWADALAKGRAVVQEHQDTYLTRNVQYARDELAIRKACRLLLKMIDSDETYRKNWGGKQFRERLITLESQTSHSYKHFAKNVRDEKHARKQKEAK